MAIPGKGREGGPGGSPSGGLPKLLVSTDCGGHWTSTDMTQPPLLPGTEPRILAVDPVDEKNVYLRIVGAVTDEPKLLFETNPDRFQKILVDGDAGARFAALDRIDDMLLCEAVRFGLYNREEMIGPLAALYHGPVMEMPETRRLAVEQHVAGFV